MKKIIFFSVLISSLFVSCKKNPLAGKIKYEAIFQGTGYSDIDIEYINEYGNVNTITNNTTPNWSQTINSTPGETYTFHLSGTPTGSFTITFRLYYGGEIKEEQITIAYFNSSSNNWTYIDNSLNYEVPL